MELASFVPEGEARDLYRKGINVISSQINSHTIQILNLLSCLPFEQIKNCPDSYIEMMFYQSRLAWLFKSKDRDFLRFYRQYFIPLRDEIRDPFDQEVFSFFDRRLQDELL